MISFRSSYLDDPPQSGRILDLFDAPESSRPNAIFFVHGGSWRAGSRTIFHTIALAYRALGFDCASADYRLENVSVFDQVADVRDSLQCFARDLQARGRTAKIALVGSSAGAHLALLAALLPRPGNADYRIAAVCVQAAPFTFEPWPDIFPAIWRDMQRAVGSSFEENPPLYRQASPLEHVHAGMPPVFALQAEHEHMFPAELTNQFAAKVQACGGAVVVKTYPRTEHGFFYGLERWQQKEAFQDILTFLERMA